MFTIKNPLAKKDLKSYNSRQCQRKKAKGTDSTKPSPLSEPPPHIRTPLNNERRFLYEMGLAPSSMMIEMGKSHETRGD